MILETGANPVLFRSCKVEKFIDESLGNREG